MVHKTFLAIQLRRSLRIARKMDRQVQSSVVKMTNKLSPKVKLPPEVLSAIFEILGESSDNIHAIRLVSHEFESAAWIAFAKTFNQKLFNVSQRSITALSSLSLHPEAALYITELCFDANTPFKDPNERCAICDIHTRNEQLVASFTGSLNADFGSDGASCSDLEHMRHNLRKAVGRLTALKTITIVVERRERQSLKEQRRHEVLNKALPQCPPAWAPQPPQVVTVHNARALTVNRMVPHGLQGNPLAYPLAAPQPSFTPFQAMHPLGQVVLNHPNFPFPPSQQPYASAPLVPALSSYAGPGLDHFRNIGVQYFRPPKIDGTAHEQMLHLIQTLARDLGRSNQIETLRSIGNVFISSFPQPQEPIGYGFSATPLWPSLKTLELDLQCHELHLAPGPRLAPLLRTLPGLLSNMPNLETLSLAFPQEDLKPGESMTEMLRPGPYVLGAFFYEPILALHFPRLHTVRFADLHTASADNLRDFFIRHVVTLRHVVLDRTSFHTHNWAPLFIHMSDDLHLDTLEITGRKDQVRSSQPPPYALVMPLPVVQNAAKVVRINGVTAAPGVRAILTRHH